MFYSWICVGGVVADLSRVGERNRLKSRTGDEPHWHRLRAGCYVGYRPSKRGGRGTWFARVFDPEQRRNRRKALGNYGDLSGAEIFAAAKKAAEAWAESVESGGDRPENLTTVADACRAYLREKPGAIAEGIFRRQIYSDPVAKVKLDKLRRHHLKAWRMRLEETPALISRNKKGEKRTKVRSPATVNRDMVPLRAALGRVLSPGTPKTEAAWQEALLPIKGVTNQRDLYLDSSQRKALIAAMEQDAAPFARALCMLPLRPGAMARLSVKDFDRRTRTLTIGKDKSGRPRQILVPPNIAKFLTDSVKDKLPAAPIFTRGDGVPWSKDKWKHPIKAAVIAAGLPSASSAYTLRHCVITDLVRSGLAILTVAQLADTSVAMIERHYGHLVRHDAEEALSSIAF